MLRNNLFKKLSDYWGSNIEGFMRFYKEPNETALQELDGIGNTKAHFLAEWCKKIKENQEDETMLYALAGELEFEAPADAADGTGGGSLVGLTFVITGSVYQYKNRDAFKASVETRGGKVAGSVSKKTSFLVNNDSQSMSGKNKKAKELGIQVITEQEFIKWYGK